MNTPFTNEDQEVLTRKETAYLLGVTVRTVTRWVNSGTLEAWKTEGGNCRIFKRSVNKILQKREDGVQSHKKQKALSLLIVEDDSILVTVYKSIIKSWSFQVDLTTVATGFDALIHIGENPPDIIITDLAMPHMDGFEMIKSLQSNPKLEGIPIIVVTALNSRKIADHGGLPEDVQIFRKPPPADQLKTLARSRAEFIGKLEEKEK
jgi:excisionase family DNA binding protein